MDRRITRSQTVFFEKQSKLHSTISTSANPKIKTKKTKVAECPLPSTDHNESKVLKKPNISMISKNTFENSSNNRIFHLSLSDPSGYSKNCLRTRSSTVSGSSPEFQTTVFTNKFQFDLKKSNQTKEMTYLEVEVAIKQSGELQLNNKISSERKTKTLVMSKTPRIPTRRSERLLRTAPSIEQPKFPTSTPNITFSTTKSVNQMKAINLTENSNKTVNFSATSATKIPLPMITNQDAVHKSVTTETKVSLQSFANKNQLQNRIVRLKSDAAKKNVETEIIIPHELKMLLIKDANIIHRHHKRYQIPGTHNVAKVIEDYVALNQSETEDRNCIAFTFSQIFESIIEYFDDLLGIQLLYESERVHYLEVINNFPGERVSTLYTPIYLLRLFVQLNSLLEFSNLDQLRSIVKFINEFSAYLADNKSIIFSDLIKFC